MTVLEARIEAAAVREVQVAADIVTLRHLVSNGIRENAKLGFDCFSFCSNGFSDNAIRLIIAEVKTAGYITDDPNQVLSRSSIHYGVLNIYWYEEDKS